MLYIYYQDEDTSYAWLTQHYIYVKYNNYYLILFNIFNFIVCKALLLFIIVTTILCSVVSGVLDAHDIIIEWLQLQSSQLGLLSTTWG